MDRNIPIHKETFVNRNTPNTGKAKKAPEVFLILKELGRWDENVLEVINDMDVYSYQKKNNYEVGTFYYADSKKLK
jgi:hypothetical protein